ncbi:MAG TPA: HEAT repeat domain-containing protein [Planctomycetaceae bacterium]|nr:HEAT repeat domain-containing protein [Planctomycetaceae bacterium]HQZ67577.1 HEAT repeat domain-containing protein [Planctomycetaceae bacterium]
MTEFRKELERLIELNHAEQWVPNHIAFQQILERHGDRIIDGLIECLPDEDAEVRQLAAGLLEEAGNRAEPAVLALTERLTDENRSVVVTAMFALKRLSQFARSAAPALKVILSNEGEPYFQIVAAATLGKIAPENPDCIPILVAALDDPNSLHRAAGCEFLGERRHSAALNTMKLFNDPDFTVRFAATKAYSKFTGDWLHAVAVCVAMLKDEDETHRAMGAECLLSIRRYVGDHLDLLQMAVVDASWESRLDLEEVLAELRGH